MAEIHCTQCGMSNPAQAKFCGSCGTPFAAAPNPAPPPAPPVYSIGQVPQPQPPAYIGQSVPSPQPYAGSPGGPTSSKGLISLICGIAGFVACGPLSAVPGIILGKMEMNAVRDGLSPPSNLGIAKAGFYISIAATVVSVVGCLIMGLFWGFSALPLLNR